MSHQGPPRIRAVLTTDLTDDPAVIEAYCRHHRQAWPDVVASLRQAGILTLDIHIAGRRLVMVLETDGRDFEECFDRHAASGPRVAEWEALMRGMQHPPAGRSRRGGWTVMEPLFTLAGA